MHVECGVHFSRVWSGREAVRITCPLFLSKAKPCNKDLLASGLLLSKKCFLINLEVVRVSKAKHIWVNPDNYGLRTHTCYVMYGRRKVWGLLQAQVRKTGSSCSKTWTHLGGFLKTVWGTGSQDVWSAQEHSSATGWQWSNRVMFQESQSLVFWFQLLWGLEFLVSMQLTSSTWWGF